MRGVRAVLLLAVVVAGLGVPVTGAPARAAGPEPVRWGPCPFDVGTSGARCGTVRVPLDYRRPDGRQIDIHVSRVPSRHPEKRRGTLIVHEGGPSAHLADASTFGGFAPAGVLDAYDVVSFDQRGFGASAPIHCGLRPDQQYTFPWPSPGGEPADRARARAIAARCAERAGDELPFLGTANVARDVDRIRQALGQPAVSFYGISYGTYLGEAYSSLFPSHLDRMLLDSTVDPATAWRGTFRAAMTAGTETRFADFAAFAVAHRDRYGLGATPAQVRQAFLSLVDRLDRAPLRTPAGTIAGTQLRIGLFGGLYNDAAFPAAADLLRAVAAGDVTAAAADASDLQVWFDDDNTASGQLGVFCADGAFPRSPAVYAAQARADAVAYPLTGGAGAAIWPCAFWPSRPLDPPVRVRSAGRPGRILLINNTRDPATILAGAEHLRREYGDRVRLVRVDHGGHGSYLIAHNACADRIGTDFLIDGAVPATDVSCPAAHAGLAGALNHLTAADGTPGALAEVRDGAGTAVLSSGVADLATGRRLRADDKVRIFSNTKAFVATVLLQLNAERKVDLDAPVERYLPGLIRGNGNDGRDITVRQVLQHTSGLPDLDTPVFEPGGYYAHRFDHHDPGELVAGALRSSRLSPPGAEFHYSTTNYVVAGMIIEKVTGRPYADAVRDRILRPFGLRNTLIPGDDPALPGRHAEGYAHLDANDQLSDQGRLIDASLLSPSLVWAGGEMVSTVPDLNTFLAALLGGRLLPPAQLAAMMATVPADELIPGAGYGLGLMRVPLSCGGVYWTHGGEGIGYQTREGSTTDGRQVSIVHTTSPSTAAQSADMLAAVDVALCEARPGRQ